MTRLLLLRLILFAVLFAPLVTARAQQQNNNNIVLPAGTLLRCTLDEPNLSPATAEIGDPVLCHLDAIQQVGRTLPRGSYLVGRITSERQPGHFVGKGSMMIIFDRIGLPNSDLPLPAKVIAVRGYRVNRDETIVGHGHAKRDAIEWMVPVLWPWKILTLPAKGPQPALKGEVLVTLRVMEDLIPSQAGAYQSVSPAAFEYRRPVGTASVTTTSMVMTGAATSRRTSLVAEDAVSQHESTQAVTLVALRSGKVYAVSHYWQSNNTLLTYTLVGGPTHTMDLADLDWSLTTQLNQERGVVFWLRKAAVTQQ